MTPAELQNAAIRLYGEHGYSVALAAALRIHYTQVWRYLNGRNPIPGPVEAAVTCWLEKLGSSPNDRPGTIREKS